MFGLSLHPSDHCKRKWIRITANFVNFIIGRAFVCCPISLLACCPNGISLEAARNVDQTQRMDAKQAHQPIAFECDTCARFAVISIPEAGSNWMLDSDARFNWAPADSSRLPKASVDRLATRLPESGDTAIEANEQEAGQTCQPV